MKKFYWRCPNLVSSFSNVFLPFVKDFRAASPMFETSIIPSQITHKAFNLSDLKGWIHVAYEGFLPHSSL